jgi:TonB family protein
MRWMLACTAFHAALLGLVIKPATPAHFSSAPRTVEEVQYLTLSLGGAHHRDRGRKPHRTVRGAPLPPRIGAIDLAFALTLVSAPAAPPTYVAPFADQLWGDPLSDSPFGRPDPSSADPGPGHGIGSDSVAYIAATVEKGAEGAGDNPKPVYPYELLTRMIEARFSVFFIVDTTGRIDATTIEVPPSVDVRFANAVRDVLVRWHFFPAEVRGRRVRQLMEQPFEFRIVNARLARAGAT